jgi:hypothetical protein
MDTKKEVRKNLHFQINSKEQCPSEKQIQDNYNKFIQNDTLYGIYDVTFDLMDKIEITGTGNSAKCKALVDKYLLGDSDDEYIDHIELEQKKEELKKFKTWIDSKSLNFLEGLAKLFQAPKLAIKT